MYEQIAVAASEGKRPLLEAAQKILEPSTSSEYYEPADNFGDGSPTSFRFYYYSDADVMRWVVARDFRCFIPDSAFSIPELERLLEERAGDSEDQAGIALFPFATTPIVLMMSPTIYAAIAKSGPPVGWSSLFSSSCELRLMHAHARSADGLAIVTAVHMAAAAALGMTDSENVNDDHDALIRAMQSSVVQYAPDDAAVVEHGLPAGRWQADVIAVQERTACLAAKRLPDLPFVAVYPQDANIWVEQVVARMASATPTERQSIERLVRGLRNPAMNQVYRSQGLRPLQDRADAHPLATLSNVQVIGTPIPPGPRPARRFLRTIRKRWTEQKKTADVCLVLDTSESMSGSKLTAAKRGVSHFVSHLEGRGASACLITFSDSVNVLVPLQSIESGKVAVEAMLARTRAMGMTALYGGVAKALDVLGDANLGDNIKAIVVLTDGQENASKITIQEVRRRLKSSGSDILVFAIAYGGDADRRTLDTLVAAGAGHSLVSDEDAIQGAFDVLSAHL